MNNLKNLSDREKKLKNGYVIVDDTLFQLENSLVCDSWDLEGESIEEKDKDARKKAEISNRKTIYYDDENCYDKYLIMDEGRLVSPFDRPMSEDEKSYCEYCANH